MKKLVLILMLLTVILACDNSVKIKQEVTCTSMSAGLYRVETTVEARKNTLTDSFYDVEYTSDYNVEKDRLAEVKSNQMRWAQGVASRMKETMRTLKQDTKTERY